MSTLVDTAPAEMVAAEGSQIGVPTRQALSPQPVTAIVEGGQEGLVRLVDLQPGQRLQATVAEVLPDGGIMLGLMGGLVRATTNLRLVAGRSYDFVVSSTHPQITLTTLPPLVMPSLAASSKAGLLGLTGQELGKALIEFLSKAPLPKREGPPDQAGQPHDSKAREVLARFVRNLDSGRLSAGDLRDLHNALGHDQEARVLRLPSRQPPSPSQVLSLRETLKAEALDLLAKEPNLLAGATKGAQRSAQNLVEGFRGVERDNAGRADQGAAQWLPLPAGSGNFLLDARLFLLPEPSERETARESDAKGERKSFTVVLLLDLSRLGQIRVDIDVRGSAVAATFQVVQSSALRLLVAHTEELRSMLSAEGLQVRSLRVLPAAAEKLPVADLVIPPPHSDESTSLVDVHA